MDKIIQLKITLRATNPPIYRQLLIEKETSFLVLHNIIQIAMGWDNYHMFEFYVNSYRIGLPYEDIESMEPGPNKLINAAEVTIEEIITSEKEKFDYEYDFGDSWTHEILIEKFIPKDKKLKYPFCIEGQQNCPPEDCGGIQGFYEMLKTIKNKKHPERKEMLEWLGGSFDPAHFDINYVNKELSNLDEYIKDWLDGLNE